MSSIIGIAVAAIVAAFFSTSVAQAQGASKKVQDCDARCEFYKRAPGTGLRPAIRGQVCFDFVQEKREYVVLTMYRSYDPSTQTGVVLREIKHKTPDGTEGRFCVGSQWVKQSAAVDICNDTNHSVRGVPSLNEGLQTGRVSMCLLGEDCPRFVRR